MKKISEEQIKKLKAWASKFEKNKTGGKAFVVGDRENTFGLIGRWTSPPTFKENGSIDASAISDGVQQDNIMEVLESVKDKDGVSTIPSAVSTVRDQKTAHV